MVEGKRVAVVVPAYEEEHLVGTALLCAQLLHRVTAVPEQAQPRHIVTLCDIIDQALKPLKAEGEASPATRFAIMSSSDTRTDILASLAAGFHGFISKHQSDTDILAAITDILSGRIYVPSSLASSLAEVGNGARRATLPTLSTGADALKLTKRQREVLSLLARGRSNKEIARALEIAEATTKIHMAALLRALGVRNRTEAAFKAGNLINSTELACAEGSRNTDTLATFRPRLVAVSKRA